VLLLLQLIALSSLSCCRPATDCIDVEYDNSIDVEYASTAACTACGAGSITDTLTVDGAKTCTACGAGTYSAVSTAACAACGAGSITDTLTVDGAKTCTACGAGT
jgi:hypothetical protein